MGFSIAGFCLDLYLLSKGRERLGMKAGVFAGYLKITLKYLILVKLLRMKLGGENFLGFRVKVPDYAVFYDLFKEIFIKGEYYFESNSRAPHVIDCGANIGMAVLYVKHLYPEASITAFEPGKEAFSFLERNCKLNGLKGVTLHNFALGAKDGKIYFYSVASGNGGVTNTAKPGKEDAGKFKKTEVECRKLSKFIKGKVDFVKMDIEGAEMDVVKELVASGKLGQLRRIIFEYHHHNHTEEAFLGKFLLMLENAGFDYRISARIYPQLGGEYAQAVMIYANKRN